MAVPRASRGRRRRDAPLGQIPLSSGEIELYSRQDEAAQRRRRLLAVRDQERRLAQQVTQRYRANLQRLQQGKSSKAQRQLSAEQQLLLTELHRRYQSSLQSMGTAQRNARSKLLELMEQAQQEKDKWAHNRQVTGKQRATEAIEAQELEEAERTARRRQVDQNMQRLKLLSGHQRQEASARARQEQEVAMQRAKDRDELDRLRRQQSPEEVFVTPRPHKKDVLSYQYTRTHCVAAATVAVGRERPAVTVIRHNRKHPTAVRGDEEAKKYSEEMDQKRERDRVVGEEQEETAAGRGRSALDDVASRQQGQQALEWLALVDKMERRARGQELGGGDDYPLDARDIDGGNNDPERMAERAFARMLGLDEDSIELSAFSIDTDDDQSVGLADTDHELSDGDKATELEVDKVKLQAAKDDDFFYSLDPGRLRRYAKDEATPRKLEKLIKGTFVGGLDREELDKLKKAKGVRENGVPSKDVEVPRTNEEHEDATGKTGTGPAGGGDVKGDHLSPNASHLQLNKHADRSARASAGDKGRQQYHNGVAEERPEGTDSEEEEMDPACYREGQGNDSIERLENRLQEVLDLRSSRPRQDRPFTARQHEEELASLSSGSEAGQHVSQLDEVAAAESRRGAVSPLISESPNASDGAGKASVVSLSAASSESGLSLSAASVLVVSGGRCSISSSDRSMANGDDLHHSEQLIGSGQDLVASNEREVVHDEGRALMGDPPLTYHGGESEPRHYMRDSRAVVASIAGDNHLEASDASFTSSYRSGEDGEGRRYDESGGRFVEMVTERKEGSMGRGRNATGEKGSPLPIDRSAGHFARQSVQEIATEKLDSRHGSATERAQQLLDAHHFSSSSIASDDEEFHEKTNVLHGSDSRMVAIDEDQRSLSESSFAPSQKSLSRLHQVANDRAKSLGQRFIDEHMISFSSSEGHSDHESEGGTDLRRPSIGSDDVHTAVNINPHDPYRQQIDHRERRSSTSAVSISQYSLPPSDTQSSFDDSFDPLHPGYGDDSFVNELVPMFPKRALPLPPRSLEVDSQVLEEYDVQLVAPNMSRMLTSKRRTSFGRSRQRLAHQEQPQAGATEHSRHQSVPGLATQSEASTKPTRFTERALSSSSRRSSSVSSNNEMDSRSLDTSVDESPRRHQQGIKRMQRLSTSVRGKNRDRFRERGQAHSAQSKAVDARSDFSSDSGVSSLGFAVQLNLAAGTSRRRNDVDRRDISSHGDSSQNLRPQENATDDELENQSITSERSFASSSSLSMDAHFNYLVNMTSAVGKSLPLHLRLPATIYGKKDMTKPPTPMAWSASSVSSIASASEVDPKEASKIGSHTVRRSVPRSNSSMSDSLLEEQHISPVRPGHMQQKMEQNARDSNSRNRPQASNRSDASDASSDNEITRGDGAERCLTFDSIKEKVARLPPPPLGSLNMSQPPPPLQKLGRRLVDSQSSSEQNSVDFRSSERQMPPPPLGSLNMSQSPPPIQNFSHGLDDSKSSSEQPFGDRKPSKESGLRPDEAEEERKQRDSSNESGASSHSDASLSSSSARSRRRSMKRVEKIVIPVKKTQSDNNVGSDEDQGESLADAFQRRHPGFGHRMESHREKLKRQRDKQQQEQQQQQEHADSGRSTAAKRGPRKVDAAAQSPQVADPLPPEKQELLDRLATGSRAKISSREMKERSRRLYLQLPEVVERKRQEEVMRRRRERLNELREQEKERRLQQKQRRQEQLQ